MKKTKIIATLGPETLDQNQIDELLCAGVDVVRLDYAQRVPEQHASIAKQVRSSAQKLGKFVGILVDIPGTKVQISEFENGHIELKQDSIFNLDGTLDSKLGNQNTVGLDYPQLLNELELGSILLLDCGRIQLQVILLDRVNQFAKTKVLAGGRLNSHQSISVLGKEILYPSLTESDWQGIEFAASIDAEFIALTLPPETSELQQLSQVLENTGFTTQLIAKFDHSRFDHDLSTIEPVLSATEVCMIENLDFVDDILDQYAASLEHPLLMKARELNKPIVAASPVMSSMASRLLPTRTEALKLANLVIAGTDAVMLCPTVTNGPYMIDAVKAMVNVISSVEAVVECFEHPIDTTQPMDASCSKNFAISTVLSISKTQRYVGVAVITHNGEAPLLMSRCQSHVPIWALSDNVKLLSSLSILRGVEPTYAVIEAHDSRDTTDSIVRLLEPEIHRNHSQSLIISCFESLEKVGTTNISRLVPIAPTEITT